MARRSSGGTPATVALSRAGIAFTLHEYPHDPRAASYGEEAAAFLADSLGVAPSRVFKTLMVSVDTRLAVGMVPVTARLDLKAVARALGGRKAEMAEVALAERATGYVAGGISPIGQRRAHPSVLDESAWTCPTVFVSGGRRGLDLELAPADLAQVTGAVRAPISRS